MKLKLFLATAMLMTAVAVTASAETTPAREFTTGGFGTIAETNLPEDQTTVLAVNPGDVISIDVTGAASDITLLSVKNGADAASDTIQYVNQYEPEEDGTTTITFAIRDLDALSDTDGAKQGIYSLKINDGNDTYEYFYKYGRPVNVDSTGAESATYYVRADFNSDGTVATEGVTTDDQTISLGYVSTFAINNASIKEYGYTVSYNGKSGTSSNPYDSLIEGEGSFAFGVTVYNIPGNTDLTDVNVTPFVNYTN